MFSSITTASTTVPQANSCLNPYHNSYLVEEMPNKEQILTIIRSTKSLIEFILNLLEDNNIKCDSLGTTKDNSRKTIQTPNKFFLVQNSSIYIDKALLISNKIIRLYLNLSRNIYGQSLILFSDFDTNENVFLPALKSNPSLNLNFFLNYVGNKLKYFDSNDNKISMHFLEMTNHFMMIILICFYDLLYFEYASNYFDGNNNPNSSNILDFNNIFTSDFISDLSKIKCVIRDNHLISLLSSISNVEINKDNIFEISKSIQEVFISFSNHLENISNKYYQTNNALFNEFNYTNENFIDTACVGEELISINQRIQNKNSTEQEEPKGNPMDISDNNLNEKFENNDNFNINDDKSQNEFKEETNIDTDMNTNVNINDGSSNVNNNFYESIDQPNVNDFVTTQQDIHLIQNILDKLNLIKRNINLIVRLLASNSTKTGFLYLEVVNSDSLNKVIKLPSARKIYEKCEMINKYYEFFQTQGIDYSLFIVNQQQCPSILTPANNINTLNPINLNNNINLNSLNNIGNTSPNNSGLANYNVNSANANAATTSNANGVANPSNNLGIQNPNSLFSKFYDIGFGKYQIPEFDKLLNWKKYRIYLSKADNLIVRKEAFDLDSCLKILPEEKLLKILNKIDFSNLSNTVFLNKRFSFVNLDGFQQFINNMTNENFIVDKYSNLSYSVTKNSLNKKLLFTDSLELDSENLNEYMFNKLSSLTCYKYDFEYSKIALNKNMNLNLTKFGSGIKNMGAISLVPQKLSKSKKLFYILFCF